MANNLPTGSEGLTYTNPTTGHVLTFRDGVWRDSDVLNPTKTLSVDAGEDNKVIPDDLSVFDYKLEGQRLAADHSGFISGISVQDIQWEETHGLDTLMKDFISIHTTDDRIPQRVIAVGDNWGISASQSGQAWVPRPESIPNSGSGQFQGGKSKHCVYGGPEGDKYWMAIPTSGSKISISKDTINWTSTANTRFHLEGGGASDTATSIYDVWDLVYWEHHNIWLITGQIRNKNNSTTKYFFDWIGHDEMQTTSPRGSWKNLWLSLPPADDPFTGSMMVWGIKKLAPGIADQSNNIGFVTGNSQASYITKTWPMQSSNWHKLHSHSYGDVGNEKGSSLGVFGGYSKGTTCLEEIDLMKDHGGNGRELSELGRVISSLECGLDDEGKGIWIATGRAGALAYSYNPTQQISVSRPNGLYTEDYDNWSWQVVCPRPLSRDIGKKDYGLDDLRKYGLDEMNNLHFNKATNTWIAGDIRHALVHNGNRIIPGGLAMSTNGIEWEGIEFFKDLANESDPRYESSFSNSGKMNTYKFWVGHDSFWYLNGYFWFILNTIEGKRLFRGQWYGTDKIVPGPLTINDHEIAVVAGENTQHSGDLAFNVSSASRSLSSAFTHGADNLSELNNNLFDSALSYEIVPNDAFDSNQPEDSYNSQYVKQSVEINQITTPTHGKIALTSDNNMHYYDSDTTSWKTL